MSVACNTIKNADQAGWWQHWPLLAKLMPHPQGLP